VLDVAKVGTHPEWWIHHNAVEGPWVSLEEITLQEGEVWEMGIEIVTELRVDFTGCPASVRLGPDEVSHTCRRFQDGMVWLNASEFDHALGKPWRGHEKIVS